MSEEGTVSRRGFITAAAGVPALTGYGPLCGTDSKETLAGMTASTESTDEEIAGETGDEGVDQTASRCANGGGYANGTPIPIGEIGNNAGAVVDGVLYSVGGFLDDVGDERKLRAIDDVLAYDVAADSWTQAVENLPRKLWGMDAIGVDGRVYAWGGAEPGAPFGEGKNGPEHMSERVYRLVPGEGWDELEATVPGGVSMESRSLYNPTDGLVYVFGGAVSTDRNTDRIWTFDPDAEAIVDEEWQTLPEPTRWPSVGLVEVDGRRYAHCIGGLAYDEDGYHTIEANVRFDLETGEAERMADLTADVTHATGQNPVLDDRIYLLKGSQALVYDPVTDAFTDVTSIGEELSFGAHGVVDGELILLGGHDKVEGGEYEGAHDAEDRVWRYTPPC